MRMRTLIAALVAGSAVALGLASPALAQAPAKKPNILFIVSDDTGYGDLGPYGGGEGRGMADAEHRPHRGRRHDVLLASTPSRAARRAAPPCKPGAFPTAAA